MNTVLLSPTSLPSAISPSSFDISSASNSSSPSNSLAPPPQSQSPPPSSPPQLTPPPTSSPPPSTAPPPTSPPPSPPAAPPPVVASPPPPILSPPPPSGGSPAPKASPAPPPPQAISPSPPLPANVPSPPKSFPPPPVITSPPPPNSPSTTPALASPPPPPPPTSSPPSNSTSGSPTTSTEKPTAKPTNGTVFSAETASAGSGGLKHGGAIAVGVIAAFVVFGFLVMAVWFTKKRKKRNAVVNDVYPMPSPFASSQGSAFLRPYSPAPLLRKGSQSDPVYSPSEPGGMNNSRSWFTYNELVQATNGFSEKNLLGEGGFGCVYKGVLTDGREIAVKQLKIGGGQGEREFRAEVEIIGRVHHRHLVSLVGYCISDHHRLLVYDYLQNDTLHFHLHAKGKPFMDWATRVKVAAGAARGIAYLHEDCHPRIIHRDIKSSNILLDDNFEARVSDFGLAKLALELDSNTHVSTRVMGTFGYMAPEYATSGKLTEKSDVYSFGVVLLELITGRKSVDDSQPLGDESLVEWARPLLSQAVEDEEFGELVDPRLEKNYVVPEMFRMIEAAAACVRHSAARRPRMSQVVRALDSLNELSDISNGMKPGQSKVYDSRQQSEQIRMFQRLAFGSQDYSSGFLNQSQSSWGSRGHNNQGSLRSREYDSRSNWSQDHRDIS